jgi:CRP-like cAMP-binding protein
MATRVTLHPFLAGMNRMHLSLLTDWMAAHFKKGQAILREGEFANRFYLIESGKVILESGAGFGDPVIIETIGPGDLLGWSWMFPPYVWHFTARAVEPTEAIFFLRNAPAGILREGPLVRLRVFQAHELRHDETLAGHSETNAFRSCQRHFLGTGCARVAVHGLGIPRVLYIAHVKR